MKKISPKLKKQLSNKLESTQKRVKNEYVIYRSKKEKILSRKLNSSTKQRLIKKVYQETISKVKKDYHQYREYKFNKIPSKLYYKDSSGFFTPKNSDKKFFFDTYRVKRFDKPFIVNKIIDRYLESHKRFNKIILIGRFKNLQTDELFFHSVVLNPESLKYLPDQDLLNELVNDLSLNKNYSDEFELIEFYIKIFE